jgi:hypothetical protein
LYLSENDPVRKNKAQLEAEYIYYYEVSVFAPAFARLEIHGVFPVDDIEVITINSPWAASCSQANDYLPYWISAACF